ncbi:unnamed protein product, partial [Iphiclides podalirius]
MRKRKAKAPSVKSVAAKYKAVAASASATPTEVEDMATEVDTEEDFADLSVASSKSRAKTILPSTEQLTLELRSQADSIIEDHIDRQLKAIEEVANRSRNLKGSFAQSLRLAVRNVKAAAEELARRATTDENIARLERENAELRLTLSSLSNRADKLTEEMNYLRKQTHERVSLTKPNADAPTPSSSEEAIMERIGAFVESKLAAFEARLLPSKALRPPLGVKSMTVATKQLTTSIQSLSAVTPSQKKRHKKKKKRQKPTYPPVADLPPVAKPVLQTSISAVTNSWADVAKKQKVHQSIQKSPQYYVPNERPTKFRRKPVRAPTSAAVTITLREGSTATYEDMRKRKAKAPSVKSVAAKYKAVAASASATPTEVEDMATEVDTEEDFADLSVASSNLRPSKEVANRSRNLKGSFAQSLRLAVRNVKAAAEELARRATTDENIARLERENAELRLTLSSLSNRADKLTEEMNYLRKQTHERVSLTKPNADAPTPSSSEEAIMERIGAFVESKLAAFEARLLPSKALRPPLGVKSMTVATKQLTTSIQSLSAVTPSQKKRHKKKKKRQKPTYPPVADLPPVAKPVLQTSISAVTNSWADVAKKQKVHQSIQKSPQYYVPNERPTKFRRKPVRAPTSAAVTITLREGSTATYANLAIR